MVNIIAGVILVLFLGVFLFFIRKVVKIPDGMITGCCRGGSELKQTASNSLRLHGIIPENTGKEVRSHVPRSQGQKDN
ncbi:hypothetical protein FACS1894161_2780 [Spirochaetia bacterium]|nr:hypothetical protein FACS1894161_2780 [Spirochaetia bacterium]